MAPTEIYRKSGQKWTAEDHATLMKMRQEGRRWAVISQRLERSPLSCRLHMHQDRKKEKAKNAALHQPQQSHSATRTQARADYRITKSSGRQYPRIAPKRIGWLSQVEEKDLEVELWRRRYACGGQAMQVEHGQGQMYDHEMEEAAKTMQAMAFQHQYPNAAGSASRSRSASDPLNKMAISAIMNEQQ